MLKSQILASLDAIIQALKCGADVLIKLKKNNNVVIKKLEFKKLASGQVETQTGEK